MELACNGCGQTFTAARADARYCSGLCRTRAHRARHDESPPARRRPLPDQLQAAMLDLDRVTRRLERLSADDRFTRTVRGRPRIQSELRHVVERRQEIQGRAEP